MALTLRGGQSAGIDAKFVDLPPSTQVGDLIVIATVGFQAVNDPRMSPIVEWSDVGQGVWVGDADTLDPVVLTGFPSIHNAAACTTWAPAVVGSVVTSEGADTTIEVPSNAGPSTICCQMAAGPVSNPGITTPPGYEFGFPASGGGGGASIDYWNGPDALSPAGVAPTGSGVTVWRCAVISLASGGVLMVRKYPVDTQRLYPPTKSRRGSRRVGGYH